MGDNLELTFFIIVFGFVFIMLIAVMVIMVSEFAEVYDEDTIKQKTKVCKRIGGQFVFERNGCHVRSGDIIKEYSFYENKKTGKWRLIE